MKFTFFILLFHSFFVKATAQSTSIQVNPDGTHTVIINNGATSTQVNPDGTHTQIFNNGATTTKVNPDGMHTVIINNGATSTQVNPDGTHTIIINSQGSAVKIWEEDTTIHVVSDSTINMPDSPIIAPVQTADCISSIKPINKTDIRNAKRKIYKKNNHAL